MSATFEMCVQATLPDTPNAISSLASESGPTPSVKPDGPTIGQSGPEAALASLSARQAKEKGLLTSGTYGPVGSISSASAALARSLANRLRAKTDSLGSTLFRLTWKERATPIGAADTCAAGFGAPHIRQRLYWVADSSIPRRTQAGEYGCARELRETAGELGDTNTTRPQGRSLSGTTDERNGSSEHIAGAPGSANGFWSACGGVDYSPIQGLPQRPSGALHAGETCSESERSSCNGFWKAHDEIWCIDGRTRPVEPGTFPLAHGVANRVGLLRGYGNSLVAPQAQAFIEACLETKAAEPELELETV